MELNNSLFEMGDASLGEDVSETLSVFNDIITGIIKKKKASSRVTLESSVSPAPSAPLTSLAPEALDVCKTLHYNDGEKAILEGYLLLMRQCVELAEKVGAA